MPARLRQAWVVQGRNLQATRAPIPQPRMSPLQGAGAQRQIVLLAVPEPAGSHPDLGAALSPSQGSRVELFDQQGQGLIQVESVAGGA